MKKIQRILVLQLKRIGDFILTVPALDRLRACYPEAEIVVAVSGPVRSLAENVPAVDRVIVLRDGALNFELWVSALAGSWDLCVDFTGTDRSQLITIGTRASIRLGYEKFSRRSFGQLAYTAKSPASVRDLHTVDFHLELLQLLPNAALSHPTLMLSQGFEVSASTQSKAMRKRIDAGSHGKFAIVHLGSAREEKFWMVERWVKVIRSLKEDWDLDVVLTGSGDGLEAPHLQKLRGLLPYPVCDLCGKLSLVELLSLIGDCELIVGVDSMAMHLAATQKTKQVALYGPTNPYHWRPRHAGALVLVAGDEKPACHFDPRAKGRDMKDLSTSSVLSAIRCLLTQ